MEPDQKGCYAILRQQNDDQGQHRKHNANHVQCTQKQKVPVPLG